MKETSMSISFDEYIKDRIELIDNQFARASIPLSTRPFHASTVIFEKYLVGHENTPLEEYVHNSVFKAIYSQIHKWYKSRYGNSLDSDQDSTCGIISIHDSLFEVSIPLSLTQEGDTDDTFRLFFPDRVLEFENVIKYVKSPLNWDSLDPAYITEIKTILDDLINQIRSIVRTMRNADVSNDDTTKNLCISVLIHINTAAQGILDTTISKVNLPFSDMHLAMEKTIKILIRQKSITPPNTHHIAELLDIMNENIDTSRLVRLHEDFPSWREVNQYRLLTPFNLYSHTGQSLQSANRSYLYKFNSEFPVHFMSDIFHFSGAFL